MVSPLVGLAVVSVYVLRMGVEEQRVASAGGR